MSGNAQHTSNRSTPSTGRQRRHLGPVLCALAALVLVASACDTSGPQRVELPIGNGTNYLGTGQLWSGEDRENRWLAISGACASREQGDRFGPVSDGNYTTTANPPSLSRNSFAGCEPGDPFHIEANPEHRPEGYVYAVAVPDSHEGQLSIEVYDAPYCASSAAGDLGGQFPVTYTVHGASGAGLVELNSTTVSPDDHGCGRWTSLLALEDAVPGTYLVQVQAVVPEPLPTSSEGSNSFALRAVSGGEFSRCAGEVHLATETTPFSEDCVTISAVGGVGILQNFPSTLPTMPIVVGSEHAGGTLIVELWDVGEGTKHVALLAPDGSPVEFRWTVLCGDASEPQGGVCPGEANPTGGRHGSGTSLDTSGWDHRQPGGHRLSSARYNDRLVRLEVDLGDHHGASGASETWRLQTGACTTSGCAVIDRMTMNVYVETSGVAPID